MLKSKYSSVLSSVAAGVTDFRGLRLLQAWDAHVATVRSSTSIRKQPVLTWFGCTTDDGLELRSSEDPHETQSWRLSLRGQMAARLAAAAKRPGATKSALVEAALDRFLGSDDDVGDTATVARRLGGLSRQLEELDRNLRIANETTALHARFHLAVTPLLPAAAQGAACALGAEQFEEFAAQVSRRVDLGIPLIRETIDRVSAVRRTLSRATLLSSSPSAPDPLFTNQVSRHRLRLMTPQRLLLPSGRTAAMTAFQNGQAAPFTDAGTCREIEVGEGAIASRRSARTSPTAARRVTKDPVENRSLILRVFLPFVLGYYIAYLFRTINAVMAAPLASRIGARCRRSGLAYLSLLPDVRRCPDTHRHAARPIWSTAGPERVAGDRGRSARPCSRCQTIF